MFWPLFSLDKGVTSAKNPSGIFQIFLCYSFVACFYTTLGYLTLRRLCVSYNFPVQLWVAAQKDHGSCKMRNIFFCKERDKSKPGWDSPRIKLRLFFSEKICREICRENCVRPWWITALCSRPEDIFQMNIKFLSIWWLFQQNLAGRNRHEVIYWTSSVET